MCYYRTDDGKCRKFTDDKYTSYCVDGPCPDDTPTNADRIRGMSDEELAEWILQLVDCDKENVMCNPTEYKLSGKCNGRCLQGRLDWLKQPSETEGKEI